MRRLAAMRLRHRAGSSFAALRPRWVLPLQQYLLMLALAALQVRLLLRRRCLSQTASARRMLRCGARVRRRSLLRLAAMRSVAQCECNRRDSCLACT
jgi:hypothetical protein